MYCEKCGSMICGRYCCHCGQKVVSPLEKFRAEERAARREFMLWVKSKGGRPLLCDHMSSTAWTIATLGVTKRCTIDSPYSAIAPLYADLYNRANIAKTLYERFLQAAQDCGVV